MTALSDPTKRMMESLAATGIVEVVEAQEYMVEETLVIRTLSRLNKGSTPAEWVHKIVRPLRIFSLRYPKKWAIRTAKEYIDRVGKTGHEVVYGFSIDLQTKEPDLTVELLSQVLRKQAVPPPEHSAHADAQTIAELPDEIIDRPLVWSRPGEEDVNIVRPVVSEYPEKTGNMYKPGRGATRIG